MVNKSDFPYFRKVMREKLVELMKKIFYDTQTNKGVIVNSQCSICNDSKQVEVLVMGTDTDWVECPYCSDKSEYKKFQDGK